jgi:NADH-quinone oxidoreductase subunit E
MNRETIQTIVAKHRDHRGAIISILEDIQARCGYLSAESLKMVADQTGRALVDIYGIATFYHAFSLKPRGKHLCSVCAGTTCHVRGAPIIAEEFERQLGVKAGGTSADMEFTLETVNCLGACALGPVAVVDGRYFPNVDTAKVKRIVKRARMGPSKQELRSDQQAFPIEVSCPRCNHSLMEAKHLIDDSPSIRMTIAFGHLHGCLRLSSLYGSYTIESEHEIPLEAVVNFFCPHCHAELLGASNCAECNAPMVPMIVRGGGIVQICSRRGCTSHLLDLNGVNT